MQQWSWAFSCLATPSPRTISQRKYLIAARLWCIITSRSFEMKLDSIATALSSERNLNRPTRVGRILHGGTRFISVFERQSTKMPLINKNGFILGSAMRKWIQILVPCVLAMCQAPEDLFTPVLMPFAVCSKDSIWCHTSLRTSESTQQPSGNISTTPRRQTMDIGAWWPGLDKVRCGYVIVNYRWRPPQPDAYRLAG